MRNLILFDTDDWRHLLPLTYTRPVADLRCGILRIREKWALLLNAQASFITQEYLTDRFPIRLEADNWLIHGGLLPTEDLVRLIRKLDPGEALLRHDELIAARLARDQFERLIGQDDIGSIRGFEIGSETMVTITRPWDLFVRNAEAIQADFDLLTKGRTSIPIPPGVQVHTPESVFIEEGAKVFPCFINASEGPVYVGKNAVVMEGAMIRGPVALCTGATVKMGARIYPGTTIGPFSKVGGEVTRSVITGYSNKGHEGFLGDSVLGEWCNLGADTTVSNLKNTYAEVRLWSYANRRFEPTGQQFCGLLMGDHSKTGINTMINTGTVVGVGVNLFGDGYPRNFIPSFSWGGAAGFRTHPFEKMLETAEAVMSRRQRTLKPEDIVILRRIYEDSAEYRTWERQSASPAS